VKSYRAIELLSVLILPPPARAGTFGVLAGGGGLRFAGDLAAFAAQRLGCGIRLLHDDLFVPLVGFLSVFC